LEGASLVFQLAAMGGVSTAELSELIVNSVLGALTPNSVCCVQKAALLDDSLLSLRNCEFRSANNLFADEECPLYFYTDKAME
jgi:hypothetical protein